MLFASTIEQILKQTKLLLIVFPIIAAPTNDILDPQPQPFLLEPLVQKGLVVLKT